MEGMTARLPVRVVMPWHWHPSCSAMDYGSCSDMRYGLHLFYLLALECIWRGLPE